MVSPSCVICKKFHQYDPEKILFDPSYKFSFDKNTCEQYPDGVPDSVFLEGAECEFCVPE